MNLEIQSSSPFPTKVHRYWVALALSVAALVGALGKLHNGRKTYCPSKLHVPNAHANRRGAS